jgi:outer membrane murein-binding lipoprotein Lpp
MARFTSVPTIPTGAGGAAGLVLNALKENVELLTGARGDKATHAVVSGQITLSGATGTFVGVTAQGQGFTVGGQMVAGYDDYAKLITDVQTLAADVATLRQTVNTLISQLRG